MIITVSETVRKQAIERFRWPPDRIVSTPLAGPSWLQPVETEPTEPYFLFVGTLEPRKNVPMLLEAWRALNGPGFPGNASPPVRLVLAGRRREDGPVILAEPGLELLGEVPDARLAELYSGALAFVYPSLYEGFGLPVVEAMQCGACVISSSAVREAGGDAAIYADTVTELVDAMRRVLTDPDWRAERRALSLIRAREFSWDRTARATHAVYQEARRRFGR
jgi:glycosyltransferase involved in cell wall biosynthesis